MPNGKAITFRFYRTIPEIITLAERKDKQHCRELGKKLNELGGFALMLTAGESVQMLDNDARIFVERIAWPGVGGWMG